MAKNIFSKSREVNKPYAIYRNGIGDYCFTHGKYQIK